MKEQQPFGDGIKLVEVPNPQPEIRKNAEKARDWEYAEEAAYLYHMANLFKDRLLDPILLTDRRRLPDPIISFKNLRNINTLATYTLARNPQGLLYEITMNTEHYVDIMVDGKNTKQWGLGKWAQLETLLHEQVHLWQQNFGKYPVQPGRAYHNKEFVEKCESLGLHPKLGAGYHLKLADGVFALVMKEINIGSPDLSKRTMSFDTDWFYWYLDTGGKRKGKSTLHKWACPVCGLNARIGIKDDPHLRHDPCEKTVGHEVFFVKVDSDSKTIYKNPTASSKK